MKNILFGLLILFLVVILASAQTAEALKFDEFERTTCDEYWNRTSFLYTELDKNPKMKAYIFVYQGKFAKPIYDRKRNLKRTDYVSPPSNEDSELIGYFKRDVAFKNIPINKVEFIKGGFREKFTIEFWLVPSGAKPPKPTPTLSKLKQRKSIRYPYGYCGEQ